MGDILNVSKISDTDAIVLNLLDVALKGDNLLSSKSKSGETTPRTRPWIICSSDRSHPKKPLISRKSVHKPFRKNVHVLFRVLPEGSFHQHVRSGSPVFSFFIFPFSLHFHILFSKFLLTDIRIM